MTAASPAPGGPEIAPDILDRDLAADLTRTALAMARRFAAGATMWCVAPGQESRARHLAAKFTRQMIAGERALPAFGLTGPDLVRQARVAVRSGDILVAAAAGADAEVADLMRRAPAWGAGSIWIGSGQRPPAGAADHVLWIDDPDLLTPGRFELLCHLLGELTRSYFEHLGPRTEPAADGCAAEVCVTCGDEGRLGEVIEPPGGLSDPVGRLDSRALVRTADGEEAVDVTVIAPVAHGDLVLVHAGTAITRLS